MKEEQIIQRLKELLTPRRLEHSLRVRDIAKELAYIYGEDANRAALAGLIHDCAKGFSPEELVGKSKAYGIEPHGIYEHQKGLIHGPLGAKMAKDLFNIGDPHIISAVRYHTFGKKDMTTLEKIIYIADLIEPGRDFQGVEELRDLAKKDLDRAVLKALDQTILSMISKGLLMHPNTIEARNSLIIKEENFCRENQKN